VSNTETAYSKPKNRLDVPTMRKHVRQKMPDCLATAELQHDTWLCLQHHIQLVITTVTLPASHQMPSIRSFSHHRSCFCQLQEQLSVMILSLSSRLLQH